MKGMVAGVRGVVGDESLELTSHLGEWFEGP
jgi:hypothetical protein